MRWAPCFTIGRVGLGSLEGLSDADNASGDNAQIKNKSAEGIFRRNPTLAINMGLPRTHPGFNLSAGAALV